MTEVLVDTSALIAFFIQAEKNHNAVRQHFLRNPQSKWIILSSVFDETVTWIRAKVSIRASIQIGQILRENHRYVHLTPDDDHAVWEAFCQYDDKFWSYTDCSLLVMVSRLKVFEVVAFDDHIRQMRGLGVVCVP